MFPKKLTEEVYDEVRKALLNGDWRILWKYPVNRATQNRIKKSKNYQDYIGPDGKYAKTGF